MIQLNLVRAVNTILDIVSAELANPYSPQPADALSISAIDISVDAQDEPVYAESNSPTSQTNCLPPSSVHLTAAHSSLWLRLTPLRQVEADLKMLLGAPSEEVTEASLHGDHSLMVATPFEAGSYPIEALPSRRPREFCVRSHQSWKDHLSGDARSVMSGRNATAGVDATEVISGCREDIELLWKDHAIKEILARRKIGLEDSAE